MTCGGGAVMMMVVCVHPHAPLNKNTHKLNQPHPHTQKMALTHSPKKTKSKLPPHSSFYIFLHVESGWFVIYLSKLHAASSLVMCVPPLDLFLTPGLPLPPWPVVTLAPCACTFRWWIHRELNCATNGTRSYILNEDLLFQQSSLNNFVVIAVKVS